MDACCNVESSSYVELVKSGTSTPRRCTTVECFGRPNLRFRCTEHLEGPGQQLMSSLRCAPLRMPIKMRLTPWVNLTNMVPQGGVDSPSPTSCQSAHTEGFRALEDSGEGTVGQSVPRAQVLWTRCGSRSSGSGSGCGWGQRPQRE